MLRNAHFAGPVVPVAEPGGLAAEFPAWESFAIADADIPPANIAPATEFDFDVDR